MVSGSWNRENIMKTWQKSLGVMAIVVLVLLVDYLSGNMLSRATVTIFYRKELVLAAFIAGLLSPGLDDGWKHNIVVYVSAFASIFAWDALLGLEVSTVPVWDSQWHWTGTWWDLLPIGMTIVEYVAGTIVSGVLFVPKAQVHRYATT